MRQPTLKFDRELAPLHAVVFRAKLEAGRLTRDTRLKAATLELAQMTEALLAANPSALQAVGVTKAQAGTLSIRLGQYYWGEKK